MSTIDAAIRLQWGDYVVVGIYFVLLIAIGLWSSCRGKRGSVGEYFLAGRNVNWFLVGCSMFAANQGTDHFIGLAGSGAATGIAVAGFELNPMFTVPLIGWLFAPVYMASGVYTMPEYINKRYGGQRIRIYLSMLSLLLTVLTKISANLFSAAIFLGQAVGWSLYPSISVVLFFSCLFTVMGGLTAVIWLDLMQIVMMLIGSVVVASLSFHEMGGYNGFVEKYMALVPPPGLANRNASCGAPPMDAMHLLRDASSMDFPWPGLTIGITILALWYFGSEQVMVQRLLAAKNFTHAKAACILTGYLKFLPLPLMVFPGMAARVLFPDEVGCSDPDQCFSVCGSRQGCTNIAYPMLMVKLLPHGMRGAMMAVMIASLIGALTCMFNSASTIFTIDIWLRFRPKASTKEQLITGKLFTVFLVVVSVLWIPVINAFPGSQLFVYLNTVISYLAPPISAVYLLGILVPRVNEKGAFWGLMASMVLGAIRFILEVVYAAPECGLPDTRPGFIAKVHYMHFGTILFTLTAITAVIVSLLTKPILKKHLHRVTFWTRHSEEDRISISDNEGSTTAASNEIPLKETNRDSEAGMTRYGSNVSTQHNDTKTQNADSNLPKLKLFFYKVFGLVEAEAIDQYQHGHEAEVNRHHKSFSLREDRFWQICCDVNAVILIGFAIFVYVFWR